MLAQQLAFQRDVAQRGRKYPAADIKHVAGFRQTAFEISRYAGHRGDEQIAERMAVDSVALGEPVLKQLRQQRFIFRQRRQTVAQIPRRRNSQRPPQPSGGAAVIGHGHHRGEIGRLLFQTAQ